MKNKIIMFFTYSLFFSVNGYCQFNTVLQKKDIPKAEPVLATTENKLIEEKEKAVVVNDALTTERLGRLHPAGRGPNSSSLFPPLAAVVAVAPSTNAPNSPIIKSSQRKAVSPCVSFTSLTCIWASGSASSPCWTTSAAF